MTENCLSTSGHFFSKILVVVSGTEVSLLFNGMKIHPTNIQTNFKNHEELSLIFTAFHDIQICEGFEAEAHQDTIVVRKSGSSDVFGT